MNRTALFWIILIAAIAVIIFGGMWFWRYLTADQEDLNQGSPAVFTCRGDNGQTYTATAMPSAQFGRDASSTAYSSMQFWEVRDKNGFNQHEPIMGMRCKLVKEGWRPYHNGVRIDTPDTN